MQRAQVKTKKKRPSAKRKTLARAAYSPIKHKHQTSNIHNTNSINNTQATKHFSFAQQSPLITRALNGAQPIAEHAAFAKNDARTTLYAACDTCESENSDSLLTKSFTPALDHSNSQVFRNTDSEEENELQAKCDQCESEEELQGKTEEEEDLQLAAEADTELEEQQTLQTQCNDCEDELATKPRRDEEAQEETVQATTEGETEEELQLNCSDCEAEENLQTKTEAVAVSQPNDPLEQQADYVADQVLLDQSHHTPQTLDSPTGDANIVQTQSEETEAEELQRLCEDCEQELQTKSTNTTATKQGDNLWQRIKQVFKTGQKLPAKVAAFFSHRIGFDYSKVQIHTDEKAAEVSSDINARAFAYQNHVVFNKGEYQPDSHSGRHLIAHELTHVAQQSAAPVLSPVNGVSAGTSINPNIQVTSTQAKVQGDGGISLSAGSNLVDDLWPIFRRVAPQSLITLIEEVNEKGFFGYIKEKISVVVDFLFSDFADQSSFITTLLETFRSFSTKIVQIVAGLANGDCEPLFAELRKLKEMVSSLANDAWTAISDFFRPVGDFFSDLWHNVGAPIVEWIGNVAGDVWNSIKGLGADIWRWAQPIIDSIKRFTSDAWGWIKDQLGISGDDTDNEGGLVQWIKDQAQSAWDSIKETLDPVIQPIRGIIDDVNDILPLEKIVNLRETVTSWLDEVAETASNMDAGEGGDVAENQTTLRRILPNIIESIKSLKDDLVGVGEWVGEKIGSAVSFGQNFLTKLSQNSLTSGLSSAFDWLKTSLVSVGIWASVTVTGLMQKIGNGLVKLSEFIEPVLTALNKIVDVVTNLLAKLPDFLMGPIWWLLPDCIKNPIKNFFLEQILGRIPFFQQLVAVGDIWETLRNTALDSLKRIFVDGDLFGAIWNFFKTMLNLIGIPAQLVVQIVANAARSFSDILQNPIAFISNLLKSVWQGATQFFGNIFSHLFGGVTEWLFGQLDGAGIPRPDLTSFQSILTFILNLLDISMENIWEILANHVGNPMVEKIKTVVEFATGAWEWITAAVNEGITGIWNKIQEQLTNLWDMVMDGVAGWINERIIVQASRWLLSLLDVSGITPVINAIIAVYHAIESFVEYINEMLQIINSVVTSIAEIAKGQIANAANILEQSMSQSIPIVVGFLANQFGLGNLGDRISEVVESLRVRVNNAIDWLVGKAVRLGRSFLDLLRRGVEFVKEWWKNRKAFKDSENNDHELYFQSERGDLIVESEPTPVNTFLSNLTIANDDPQKSQKLTAKSQAESTYSEIINIKTRLAALANGVDDSELKTELVAKIDVLATHLSPLLSSVGDSGGRLPNPLRLADLDSDPVATPRTPEEEQIDLNGAKQIVLLAATDIEGTKNLAELFAKIKARFVLADIGYIKQGDSVKVRIKVSASKQDDVAISIPLQGISDELFSTSHIDYTQGKAAGDDVAKHMVADPVGPDKIDKGWGPEPSALKKVMNKLVTNPDRKNPSKYIRGHLLNGLIGGPGDKTNMYPITAEANKNHNTDIEEHVKLWIRTSHYWAYYSVNVKNVNEHIVNASAKDPENYINSTFDCHAYIKTTDGSKKNEIKRDIASTYVKQDGEIEQVATIELDASVRTAVGGLAGDKRAEIRTRVANYNQTASAQIALGTARIRWLLYAYNHPGDLSEDATFMGEGSANTSGQGSITYINNRASTIAAAINNNSASVET